MSPARSASLSAVDLSIARGPIQILDRVSLTIGPQSRIGIVGPNGAGKTTLLRALAGLEVPDSGSVSRSPATLTVGYLPQEPDVGDGETLLGFLGRRTGVAEAEAQLESAASAIAAGGESAGGRSAPDPRSAEGALSPEDAYGGALHRFLSLGGPDLEARAASVCAELGLAAGLLHHQVAALSGGEAARASLAAILLSRFEVTLLDEPTNDLDFDGLARLERFVESLPGGLAVVSHDRAFLDQTVESVVELDEHSRRATTYGGGWTAFLEARATARRHAEEAYLEGQAARQRLLERARTQRQWSVTGTRREARKPRDNDKAQRDWRVNRTEKQASKVRITERALSRLELPDKPWEGWRLDLRIAAAPRSGDVVARLSGAVVERGAFRLGPVDLEIGWAERIAFLGPNGCGKTTLLDALLGRLGLDAGSRWIGPSVVVGELDQTRRQFMGPAKVLDTFAAGSGMSPQEARSLLAKLGLGSDHALRPTSTLSPGERTRACLAALSARGVNCLVLDEPTNHLDLDAIEQLESGLDSFDGTLLLVTHDRRLLDAVRTTRSLDVAGMSGHDRRSTGHG